MKRRNFLKAMLAVPLVAVAPDVVAKGVRGQRSNHVVMGIDLAKGKPKWTNYTMHYDIDTVGSRDELIKKFREAHANTKFKAPAKYLMFRGKRVYYG